MRIAIPVLAALFVVAHAPIHARQSAAAVAPAPAGDERIRAILARRIDLEKQSLGIVVGLVDAKGRRVVTHGSASNGSTRPLDGGTVYEIGSITKVFTALLLADMMGKGEVALADPIAKYLPAGIKVPERAGRAITLQDLATHVSGLPRMPNNFAPANPQSPYEDYGMDRLTQFLSAYTLTRDIGSQYEYSNLGAGLLGTLLSRRAGMDYDALIEQRILKPLRMESTGVVLTPGMKSRLATGHDQRLEPVANWDFPSKTSALGGAGGLRSTADDLLTFVAAAMGLTRTPLAPSFDALLEVRRPTGRPNMEIALGWHISTRTDKTIVWHNGGTAGYRSFVGFDKRAGVGVAVLSNAFTPVGIDDIGFHLLDPTSPLWTISAPQAPKGSD